VGIIFRKSGKGRPGSMCRIRHIAIERRWAVALYVRGFRRCPTVHFYREPRTDECSRTRVWAMQSRINSPNQTVLEPWIGISRRTKATSLNTYGILLKSASSHLSGLHW